ncbi:hypothetical protein P154DRAFT_485125 [Amniculicola lignicola CBS 123094]|uniref:Zn(2)-C6 fungal-type domain-containing protein n=1 Tax=Amniculicola lignicola CBS 123094 TaxID=1392246 RepID=A0A6A5WU59_9PLEO|nr:hypothetical protein P154DRAFT_485125 [Amniculicola lignicola CBS 123094]
MVEISKLGSQSPTSTNSPARPAGAGGRQRVIASCLTCRRRKVKCDHGHPICGACTRGSHLCTYATDQAIAQNGTNRISKPTISPVGKGSRGIDVQARLDRLELLLEKAVGGQQAPPRFTGQNSNSDFEKRDANTGLTPSSNSQSSHGAGMSSDNSDGTLLLEEGQSQFVSSLHWALLADEIQDIKALLGDKSDDEREVPTQNNMVALLSLGRASIGTTLKSLLPETQEMQDALLNLYFSNVDPMVRITHNPTFFRKFQYHVREVQPLAFAVFYSAINSLTPSAVEEKFGESKTEMLARYELGVEISLARENYLTSSSLEILQGFVIWLTCITKEDDMGKAWALLGLAIRIALNQGLHRDPSLFPAGSMDAVTIELRRRLWHQICHLEYRAAECKGQEPSITDDDFTTMLPRNIEDDELIEGASPGPSAYDEQRFTSMSFQLIRFVGMRALRRVVQSTYRLERRMLECGLHGTAGPDPVRELTNIYEQIKLLVDEMHEENHRKILKYADPTVAKERLCLGLSSLLEWRCYLLFWLRMPRAYRDLVFSVDIRKSIFEKSVNCVETLNGASIDVEAARFQWHIGGHAAFQAIMHMLSELRNPLFDVPDRQRALRALQMSRVLKETNNTKAWTVVKSMIDKVVSEQSNSETHSQTSSSFETPPSTSANNSAGPQYLPYVNGIPSYAIQRSANQAPQQMIVSAPPPQILQPQPVQTPFNWDDINLNNIIGIGDTQQNQEMPEFDFGFWGDPVTFNDTMAYPSEADISYFPPQGL